MAAQTASLNSIGKAGLTDPPQIPQWWEPHENSELDLWQ